MSITHVNHQCQSPGEFGGRSTEEDNGVSRVLIGLTRMPPPCPCSTGRAWTAPCQGLMSSSNYTFNLLERSYTLPFPTPYQLGASLPAEVRSPAHGDDPDQDDLLDGAPEPLVPQVVGGDGVAHHQVAEQADRHRNQPRETWFFNYRSPSLTC